MQRGGPSKRTDRCPRDNPPYLAHRMSEEKYLVRAPLLDPKQQVVGYKLAWRGVPASSGQEDVQQLLVLVSERAQASELGLLFIDAACYIPSGGWVIENPPRNAVLMLDCADLTEDSLAGMAAMREQGLRLALRGVDKAFMELHASTLLPLVTHLELVVGDPDFAAIIALAKHLNPPPRVVVKSFQGWKEFDACMPSGVGGFFPALCSTPRPKNAGAALSPQGVLILRLMQMVQENADVRQIEGVLKRDAALSYKLFHYINSPGFGIEVEIASLRHAVAMLGYTPLFRWLSVLLATTNTTGYSNALLQAAIVRGRFAELLGKDLLPRAEAEHLFFVGMFSLLDQLLGVALPTVVEQIVLPDAVVQALLRREGVYGPFLALVEACEQPDGRVAEMAEALLMTSTRVNQAHLAALTWAHSVSI
jgi:c-di-GMP-related signal transduction protein